MRRRDQYTLELTATVADMFASGRTDPSADEIAAEHFPGKALGGEIAESIRKRLPKIRDLLVEDYELGVCLLSPTYYSRFRIRPPTTQADARRCIPLGHAVKAVGIHLLGGDDDLIWQAMVGQNFAAGGGKVKKAANVTLAAYAGGKLSEGHAGELLAAGSRRMTPDHPELAAEIAKALPTKHD